MELLINRVNKRNQFLFSILLVLAVSSLCFVLPAYIDHYVVALILLLTVSLVAVSFDILPVLVSAALSAFIWDFFFIPPRFTLHVHSTEDTLLLIMYFIIALINAVLTYKIRQIEKISRQKEEKANAIKLYNTFLNSLSHELRTPIAAIIGATDNLQAGNGHLTAQNKQELIAEISKASLRLNQQVENLLNMSRIESGFLKPRKDWCDIEEIIYEVVKQIEEAKPSQSIQIHIVPQLPLFRLDKTMLEQILFNLVSNAILYTQSSGVVGIHAVHENDMLHLIVEDNGEGFPEEEIEKVFDKFYRLKNSTINGTGLGLSIVRGFTEALNGTVSLTNQPGGGARFHVKIPAETARIKVGL